MGMEEGVIFSLIVEGPSIGALNLHDGRALRRIAASFKSFRKREISAKNRKI